MAGGAGPELPPVRVPGAHLGGRRARSRGRSHPGRQLQEPEHGRRRRSRSALPPAPWRTGAASTEHRDPPRPARPSRSPGTGRAGTGGGSSPATGSRPGCSPSPSRPPGDTGQAPSSAQPGWGHTGSSTTPRGPRTHSPDCALAPPGHPSPTPRPHSVPGEPRSHAQFPPPQQQGAGTPQPPPKSKTRPVVSPPSLMDKTMILRMQLGDAAGLPRTAPIPEGIGGSQRLVSPPTAPPWIPVRSAPSPRPPPATPQHPERSWDTPSAIGAGRKGKRPKQ